MVGVAEVRRILAERLALVAAPDAEAVVASASALRAKLEGLDSRRYRRFRDQVELALECVADYCRGSAQQIPLYTIAVLTAALLYFQSPVGIIADFLPGIGYADDALVMAVAFSMGADGVRRYCAVKGYRAERFL